MPNLLEKTGKIVFLRAHDLGTGFGPPNDQLDVEAVFCLNAIAEGAEKDDLSGFFEQIGHG